MPDFKPILSQKIAQNWFDEKDVIVNGIATLNISGESQLSFVDT